MSVLAAPLRFLAEDELVEFATALAQAPRAALLADAPSGTRRYTEIWADRHVNAWLIGWSGDADTGFHDHDVSAAGILVLDGGLLEERLSVQGPPIARRFGPGDRFSLAPSAIHRVRHGGGRPALSIHAYSPPLVTQGVYRVTADGALERDAVTSGEELRPAPVQAPAAASRGCASYEELKRKYATDAPASAWRGLPDAELRADLRSAARLRAAAASARQVVGTNLIASWITGELRRRRAGDRDGAGDDGGGERGNGRRSAERVPRVARLARFTGDPSR